MTDHETLVALLTDHREHGYWAQSAGAPESGWYCRCETLIARNGPNVEWSPRWQAVHVIEVLTRAGWVHPDE